LDALDKGGILGAVADLRLAHRDQPAVEGRGWSWRQLARELGLSASTMSRLANGQKPDVDAFAAMVAWLQTDANKFIITEEQRVSGMSRRSRTW
jgi:transcriptional regulator with XRE-family HTH domain